jgi:hypothetical protein
MVYVPHRLSSREIVGQCVHVRAMYIRLDVSKRQPDDDDLLASRTCDVFFIVVNGNDKINDVMMDTGEDAYDE